MTYMGRSMEWAICEGMARADRVIDMWLVYAAVLTGVALLSLCWYLLSRLK